MAGLLYLIVGVVCFHRTCAQDQDPNAYLNVERNKDILEGRPLEHIPPSLVTSLTNWNIQTETDDNLSKDNEKAGNVDRLNENLDIDGERIAGGGNGDERLLGRIKEEIEKLRRGEDERLSGRVGAPSDTCLNDTETLVAGIQNSEFWALHMFDAFGKPGAGILRGQLDWLGSYDECFSVNISSTDIGFKSRYCKLTALPQDYLNQTSMTTTNMTMIILGLCLPDTCSNMDITALFADTLASVNMTGSVECFQQTVPFDTKAIVALVICSVFACLVVAGTAYDVMFTQINTTTKPKASLNDKYGSVSVSKEKLNREKEPLLTESTAVSVEETDLSARNPKGGEKQENPEKTALWARLLLSFSAYTNGAKLLSTKQATGSLTSVHGIRFLSMTWVMLGHSYTSLMGFGASVAPYLQQHVKWWTFHGILNALVSVDTFFTLSGLLVSYLTMKELKRGSGKTNWVMYYFHRFWRLTPVYMMVMMFYICLFRYLGDGPIWAQSGLQTHECEDNWWTNLLYVNNLVNRDKMCFAHSWYLANDMQFYILTPLILIPLYYSELLGMAMVGVFLLATMLSAGLITRLSNLPAGFVYLTEGKQGPGNYLDYYFTPYCRMGPYLMGMVAGYFLYKHQGKGISKNLVICGWLIATASSLAVLYGPYESANGTPMTSDTAALYNAVHRTVWGAAVSWVVVACATGNGGYVNTLLSWSAFVPLSRLSYCAYLTHPMIQYLHFNTLRSVFYITDISITYSFLGFVVATYGVSFIVSLTFEAPMMGLERVIFKRGTSK